jgi:hypothetical protein
LQSRYVYDIAKSTSIHKYSTNLRISKHTTKVLQLEKLVAPPPVGHGPMYQKYWNREIDVMKALQGHPNIVCLEGIEV